MFSFHYIDEYCMYKTLIYYAFIFKYKYVQSYIFHFILFILILSLCLTHGATFSLCIKLCHLLSIYDLYPREAKSSMSTTVNELD